MASAGVINASDINVYIAAGTAMVKVAEITSASLSLTHSPRIITSNESAGWERRAKGKLDWEMSGNSLFRFDKQRLGIKASKKVLFEANPGSGTTFIVNTTTFEFVTEFSPSPTVYEVEIGLDADETVENLVGKINDATGLDFESLESASAQLQIIAKESGPFDIDLSGTFTSYVVSDEVEGEAARYTFADFKDLYENGTRVYLEWKTEDGDDDVYAGYSVITQAQASGSTEENETISFAFAGDGEFEINPD
jgi:hypothetical protein